MITHRSHSTISDFGDSKNKLMSDIVSQLDVVSHANDSLDDVVSMSDLDSVSHGVIQI